jgi:hypothetical protein
MAEDLTSYEKRMEKMNDEFNAWWDDWGDTPEEIEEATKFFEGVSKEKAESIFIAGYRLGGHIPWMSMSPMQLAALGKQYAESIK